MVLYTCPRCRYTTNQRGDIRKHFKRKKSCINLYSNLSPRECLSAVLEDKNAKNTVKTECKKIKSKKTPKNGQKDTKKAPFYSKITHFTQKSPKKREKKKTETKKELA